MALFRKLTGGGEFCSDAHRQSYQDEYNRLALTRLLQTRNPGDEAPAATLPAPSRRLQRRAGSVLDLDGAAPAAAAPAAAAPVAKSTAPPTPASHADTPPPAEEHHDPQRRPGFVALKQAGMPGTIGNRGEIAPSLISASPQIPAIPPCSAEAGLRKRAGNCYQPGAPKTLAPGTSPKAPQQTSMVRSDCVVPDLAVASATVPTVTTAGKLPVTVPAPAIAAASARTIAIEPVTAHELTIVPAPAAPAQQCVLGTAAPLPFAPGPDTEGMHGCRMAEPADFPPCFDFADTLGTGFVAGMKLGEEQIRFELPVSSRPTPEAASSETSADAAQDEVLPHEFIAAVQAIDASCNDWTEHKTDTRMPVAVGAEAGPSTAACGNLCAWVPVELNPVPASARQRLMQAFQGVGIAAMEPGAPDLNLLPVRPKYVLGRTPADAETAESVSVAVAPEPPLTAPAAAVAPPPEEPQELSRPAVPGLQTIPVQDSLAFLQDYEKKDKSAISKLLGRIGLSCLLLIACAGGTHSGASTADIAARHPGNALEQRRNV